MPTKEYTGIERRSVESARLDRIEQKLDQVADALQTLARTEEKLLAANRRLDVIERKMETGYQDHIKLMEAAKDNHMTSMILDRVVLRLDQMEDNLSSIRTEMTQSNSFRAVVEKGFWVVFTAAVGAVVFLFQQGE